jgi:hypothetical protein
MSLPARLAARLVLATRVLDRGYQAFDRLRSLAVLAFATPAFLDDYTRLAYDTTSTYRAGARDFRQGLFRWEARAIDERFPPPPARVLIGGAGGGREAFALIERGYTVVAFDAAPALAASMRKATPSLGPEALRAFCASYDDLPMIAPDVDLRREPPFDAAIVGWTSFSHLVSDESRVHALAQMGAVTRGPILVSYFGQELAAPESRYRLLRWLDRRAKRWGEATFTTSIGFSRLFSETEINALITREGLTVETFERDSSWPFVVVRHP